jgi:hypothetical protein
MLGNGSGLRASGRDTSGICSELNMLKPAKNVTLDVNHIGAAVLGRLEPRLQNGVGSPASLGDAEK